MMRTLLPLLISFRRRIACSRGRNLRRLLSVHRICNAEQASSVQQIPDFLIILAPVLHRLDV
jgi:hypothetical protein